VSIFLFILSFVLDLLALNCGDMLLSALRDNNNNNYHYYYFHYYIYTIRYYYNLYYNNRCPP